MEKNFGATPIQNHLKFAKFKISKKPTKAPTPKSKSYEAGMATSKTTIMVIVFSILGVFIIGLIIFFIVKKRKKKDKKSEETLLGNANQHITLTRGSFTQFEPKIVHR